MNLHRITYEILAAPAGVHYRATCGCGTRHDSTNHYALSAWGPRHVLAATKPPRPRNAFLARILEQVGRATALAA